MFWNNALLLAIVINGQWFKCSKLVKLESLLGQKTGKIW